MMLRANSFKGRSSPMKNSTIIIEEEDSLLVDSQIKEFLSTQQNQQSISNSNQRIQTPKEHLLNRKRSSLVRFSTTSVDSLLKPKINSVRLQSSLNFYPQNSLHFSQFKLSSKLKTNNPKLDPIKPFQNTVFKKLQTFKKNDKLQNFIENRKLWPAQLIRKSTQQLKKIQNQSFNSQKNLSKSFISVKSTQKTSKNIFAKQKLLKSISTSTWLNVNPQKKKQSLIFLSKKDKQERKKSISLDQSFKITQNRAKSLNKFLMMGQTKIQRLLSKNKVKQQQKSMMKPNLSSKQLVNKKILEKRVQNELLLEKKGLIVKNPFRTRTYSKLQILKNPYSEFL